ncbi:unnamed protein product [Chrysoparadoxa australica]
MFVLKDGHGVAFLIEPCQGSLPAWGVQEVTVTQYNDMPGQYLDDLEANVAGAAITKIPVRVGVSGCPLSLKKEVLGLDMMSDVPELSFGEVCVNGGHTTRIIKVKNAGTLTAVLTWTMHRPSSELSPELVSLSIGPPAPGGEDGKGRENLVDLQLSYKEQEPFDSPFEVQPTVGEIPPRKDAIFRILLPEHRPGSMGAMLVADAHWSMPEDKQQKEQKPARHHHNQNPQGAEGNGNGKAVEGTCMQSMSSVSDAGQAPQAPPGTAAEHHSTGPQPLKDTLAALSMMVVAKGITPHLLIDKHTHTSGKQFLKFETHSTRVPSFSKPLNAFTTRRDASAPSFRQTTRKLNLIQKLLGEDGLDQTLLRSFALTNPLSIPLTFTIQATDPFLLAAARTGDASLHPLCRTRGKVRSCTSAAMLLGDDGTYTLLPGHTMNLDMAFVPLGHDFAKSLTNSHTAGTKEELSLKQEVGGELKIGYSSGHEQFVHLKGVLLRPTVGLSPPMHNFGITHVERTATATLYLTNPTEVDARWSIHFVPTPPPKRPLPLDSVDGRVPPPPFQDDPSVFTFSQEEGTQRGPSLALPCSGACLPRDQNRIPEGTWKQDVTELTWGREDALTMERSLRRQNISEKWRTPLPIVVTFQPHKNLRYKCRFRVEVERGEAFELVLEGHGTYEEGTAPSKAPRV